MSETEEQEEEKVPPTMEAFLQRLFRDPRYLLIGKLERYGRERIAYLEACTVLSATGEVRGQTLLNSEFYLHGRPDGERPFGYDSLLDFYLARGRGETAALSEDEHAVLRDESWQYYVRRNFAFLLSDCAQARDDAEHNLAISNFIEESEINDAAKWSVQRWWPWIERDRAIAQALCDIEQGKLEQAATELYLAGRSIEQFGVRHAAEYASEEGEGASLCSHMSEHISTLIEILRREKSLPVSLEEQVETATESGDQDNLERLREEMIRRAMEEGE